MDAGAATVETCDSSNAIAVRALLGFVDGVFPGAVANGACDDFIAVAYYTHLGIGALLGAFTLVLSPGDEGNATANACGAGEEGQDSVLFEHARCGPSRQSAPFGHIDHWLGPEERPAQWRRPFDAGRQWGRANEQRRGIHCDGRAGRAGDVSVGARSSDVVATYGWD